MTGTRLLSYVNPNHGIDHTGEKDMDVLAEIAMGIAEKLREFDNRRLFEELAQLCHHHPYKAAQIIMCLAAWVNTDEPVKAMWARVGSIVESRFAA